MYIILIDYAAKVVVDLMNYFLICRNNKHSKMMVTNKARVEGSIVQATLLKEITTYCSSYFAENFTSKLSNRDKHRVQEDDHSSMRLSIFDKFGSVIGRGTRGTLNEDDYAAAHNYVLFNCPEIQPLLMYEFYFL
jgi:Domain of unknown function (DUF4218)